MYMHGKVCGSMCMCKYIYLLFSSEVFAVPSPPPSNPSSSELASNSLIFRHNLLWTPISFSSYLFLFSSFRLLYFLLPLPFSFLQPHFLPLISFSYFLHYFIFLIFILILFSALYSLPLLQSFSSSSSFSSLFLIVFTLSSSLSLPRFPPSRLPLL